MLRENRVARLRKQHSAPTHPSLLYVRPEFLLSTRLPGRKSRQNTKFKDRPQASSVPAPIFVFSCNVSVESLFRSLQNICSALPHQFSPVQQMPEFMFIGETRLKAHAKFVGSDPGSFPAV